MKIAICTLMKNGHEYLREWLDYHFHLGIDDIFIYEDYNSKSHLDICVNYEHVILDSIENMIESDKTIHMRQMLLWNAFIDRYKDEYDWVAFIDLDEFIMLDDGLEIKSFLTSYNDYSGLFMFWKMFTADGRIENPHKPLLDTYKAVFDKPIPCKIQFPFKSFVNLKSICPRMMCNHEVYGGVDVHGNYGTHNINYDKIWLNHYFTRSWEEWSDRFFERGHICTGNREIDDFFLINTEMKEMREDLMKFSLDKIKNKFSSRFKKNDNNQFNII